MRRRAVSKSAASGFRPRHIEAVERDGPGQGRFDATARHAAWSRVDGRMREDAMANRACARLSASWHTARVDQLQVGFVCTSERLRAQIDVRAARRSKMSSRHARNSS